ncbi:hypothetical protein [Paenibacillus sp. UMB7766-LJ446]|nr:hypothetical protein [Paenibacillus sp. UMB7766-LJ446]
MDMERNLRLMPWCVFFAATIKIPGERQIETGISVMRIKIKIRCKQCGERFTLRGKKERGRIETGFKQCLCDNRDQFEIEEDGGTTWVQLN